MVAALETRPVRAEDAEALALLHVEVWEQAYGGLLPTTLLAQRRAGLADRAERWRGIIAGSPAATAVAVLAGQLVGFASVGPARDDAAPTPEELWALYVHADCWGAGVGHRLLVEGLGERPAYLWVLDGNERATTFYRRQGFVADGVSRTDDVGRERRMVRPG